MARRVNAFRLLIGLTLAVQATVGSAPTPSTARSAPSDTDETGRLSGIAACNVPPLKTLPSATVTIFSGAAQVATTHASENGEWMVDGAAPNARYTVRYQQSEGHIACEVPLTTNADGTGEASTSTACPDPDRGNRTWLTASAVPASSAGVQVSDSICSPGQSRWYRVPVLPGQQVTAEVLDPSFDVTLALFKDIRQAADEMNAAQAAGLTLEDVRRFTASIPHDVAAPDITSPDITSPDITSPDITSPDITSPDITSPDITSPDITSPDITSPDITSPDITSPDITSPDAYSSAQLQSILAYSDKPGPASEFVRRHTWDNTGSFYVRVRGHNDAFDDSHPFTLRVTVVDRDCTGDAGRLTLRTSQPSFSGLPSSTPRTLILTNSARFAPGSDTAGLLTSLRTFATRPEVGGAVVDLAADKGLAADYAQWDALPDCVPAANIVANQIHAIEDAVRSHSPGNLQYVVVAGGDRVIPFTRIPDESGLSNEHDYSPAVKDFSESQASLKTGYFLSQDPYGSFSRITLRDHLTPAFDVPVGRLVENVADIQSTLAAYTTTNGVIQPGRALVAGYDFLADSSAVEQADLIQSGLSVDSLIQPEGDGPLAASAWHADDLRARLFGPTRYGIVELNSHFSGNTLLASDMSSRVRSREVAAVTDGRFTNALILSMGCHSGYNIVDPDATPGTQPVDWAQAFAQQGATLIGGTGYQYGNSPLIKYSEVLMSSITHQLRLFDSGGVPGAVPIGRAVIEAKRAYVHGGMTGIDEKALAELTLYGLPMLAVNLPAGRVARPAPTPPITPKPGTRAGLTFADLSPTYQLTPHDRVLNVVGGGTTIATYFDATYGAVTADTQTTPGQPVLPQVVTDVSANGTLARGAIMLAARYIDLPTSPLSQKNGFRPLVDNAPTEVRGVRQSYASSIFAPAQIALLNDLDGQFLLERPFQFRSNDSSVFGIARRYDSVSTRVYYSNRLDASALSASPVIYSTALRADPANASRLLIDVTVGGLGTADIEDVFATFTSDPSEGRNSFYGRWQSLALLAGPTTQKGVGFFRHYTGVIDTSETGATPESIRLFIQAVAGNGLVSAATNNGTYFRFVTETATLGSPKLSTRVALQQPVGVAYDAPYRFPLHVTARLTNAVSGAPIAGKNLTFSLGRGALRATTGADGAASADLPVLVIPDSPLPRVSVEFAEDTGLLGSSDQRDVNVQPAPTAFVLSPSTVAYGDAANVATLVARLPSGNKPLGEVGVHVVLSDGRQLDGITDGFGRVLFDTLDFEGVQPGTYTTTLSYAGNERYSPTSVTITQVVAPDGDHSLALNGHGYAEAPPSRELNLTGDWTVEAWFKDEDPKGFNHPDREILNKGDGVAPEAPYFLRVGRGRVAAGLRTHRRDFSVEFNLSEAGLKPAEWHHVAATFHSLDRRLDLFVDGVFVRDRLVPGASHGNRLPLEIGRTGPRSNACAPEKSDVDDCDESEDVAQSSAHWLGKLDDIRIWSIARSGADIAANLHHQLTTTPTGLVANWKFDERLGTFLAYSAVGTHTATMSTTGASLSTDVHR